MDEFNIPAGFEDIWARVTQVSMQQNPPQTKCSRLERFMDGEMASITFYQDLMCRCSMGEKQIIGRILADEKRHMAALQMEYFMETGDSYMPASSPGPRGGMISSFRESSLTEADTCMAYREAAEECTGALKQLYIDIAADEERHSAQLRELVRRMFRQRG